MEDVNISLELMRVQGKDDTTRITVKKIRSRQATIKVEDQFVLHYNHDTMRLAPGTIRLTMAMAKYLIDKYTLADAASKIGVSKQAMSNYGAGQREPKGKYKTTLEDICKEEGYVPRLTDI